MAMSSLVQKLPRVEAARVGLEEMSQAVAHLHLVGAFLGEVLGGGRRIQAKRKLKNSRGPLYPSPGSGQRRAWCWVLQTYLLRDAPGHIGCSWWSHLQTLQVLFQPFFEAVTRYFAGCSWTVPKILVADPSLYLCRA